MLDERDVQCPWCFETITLFIDASVPEQTYIEDCSVCCRPIQVTVVAEDGEITSLQADRS
jgi:hypothetical protein